MPGNKFGVGELWDGIKKAVADAWNEVSQKFTGLLKEIGDLVRKNLPAINLILKIVLNLPPLIRSILDLVKQIPKLISGIVQSVWKIPGEVVKALRQPLKVVQSAITTGLKNLDSSLKRAFSSAIRPLPKNIQNGVRDLLKPLYNTLKGGFKEVSKLPGEVRKIGTSFSKELGKVQTGIGKQLLSSIGGVTKTISGLIGKVDKGVLSAREYLFKAINVAQGKAVLATNKLGTDIRNFSTAEFKRMGSRVEAVLTEGKNASKTAQAAAKSIGDFPGKTQTLLVKTRAEIAADLNKLLSKQITEFNKATLSTAVGVEKNLAKVGAEVASSAEAAKGIGRFISEALPMLKSMAKIAINAAPIIDGFADYMQFEELNAKLDILIKRQEYQTDALSDVGISAKTIIRKLEKLQSGGSSGSENKELLSAIRSELNGLATKLAPTAPAASAASIAQEVVSRLPANNPVGAEAIAQAVAAKIPKGASDTQIAAAVVAALGKASGGAAVPADSILAIADAVKGKLDPSFQAIDGKLPKNGIFRVDKTGIADAVKGQLDPSFQSIDGKLPKNGIFRVDQTGIANAVSAKIGAQQAQPTANPQLQQIQQQVTGLGQQITNLSQQTTNAFNSFTQNTFSPDLRSYLNTQFAALAQINRATASSLSTEIKSIPEQVRFPTVDLKPLLSAIGDVSKAVGAPQLKAGVNLAPDADFVKLAKKLDNGAGSTILNSLPQMMMALAAVPYARHGLHRLGGDFDRSLMNPSLGKTKITDSLGFQKWSFDQIEERLGMPTPHTVKNHNGQVQSKTFRSLQDTIEETNSSTVVALQDLEVVERYSFAIAQDLQKLMQIALQTREDVDLLIDDAGCKFKEVKRSHPTHLNLKSPDKQSSLENLFQQGKVYYVARVWEDSADKNQKLEKMGYDTQIAAMASKFEWDKTNPVLPLNNSRANAKRQGDEVWKTFVSTVTEPPEGYVSKGNPIPVIKAIENGSTKNIPKPTIPTKKLGQ